MPGIVWPVPAENLRAIAAIWNFWASYYPLYLQLSQRQPPTKRRKSTSVLHAAFL